MSSSDEAEVAPVKSLNRKPENRTEISDSDEVDMEDMIKSLFEHRSNSNKLCEILRYLRVTDFFHEFFNDDEI